MSTTSEYTWDRDMNMYTWTERWGDWGDWKVYQFRYNEKKKITEYATEGNGKINWVFHAAGNTAPKDIIAHAAANARAIYNRLEDERYRERENGKPDWDGQEPDPLQWALPTGTNFEARRAQAQRAAYLYRLRVDKEKQDRAWWEAQHGEFGDHSWFQDGNDEQGWKGTQWPPTAGGSQKRFRKSRRHNKRRRTKKSRRHRK